MKKIRITLTVLAVILAFGGAMASQFLRAPIQGYEFIDNADPMEDQCVNRGGVCDLEGTIPCTVNGGPVLRENNSISTQCGQELFKLAE